MKSSSKTVIGVPADRIDVRAWLAILSDRDYQACSPAHMVAGDSNSSLFRCSVEVRLPPVLTLLGTLALLPLFLRWHVEGETPLFAADLARKVADGRLVAREVAA